MTTATAATWPTEASLEAAGNALNKAFNEIETAVYGLNRIVGPWMDGGERPDPPPTLEIVGTVFSFLETLKSEITCLQRERDDLEELLRQIDSMRLDIAKADSA